MNKQEAIKYKVKIRFVGGASIDYTSSDKEELNSIRHCLDSGLPIYLKDGHRTTCVSTNNILVIEVEEVMHE